MAYTINDTITRTRQIVQDVDIPYRHSDDKLIGYFNDAMADVRRLRPDLFIGTLSDPWVQYTTSNLADPYPIDFTYFTPVVDFISGTIGIEDDEYAVDGRAIALHQRFIKKLMGKFG